MEIVCSDNSVYKLSGIELKKAAEEWDYLCLMQRIISHISYYYQLPLSHKAATAYEKKNLERFYDLYHIPFESLVKVYESPVESLVDCPDQVYLFLSSLAQSYKNEVDPNLPERASFVTFLRDKELQFEDRGTPERCTQLGFFIQSSDTILVCDPATPKADKNLSLLKNVEQGAWQAAAQIVSTDKGEVPGTPMIAFLLAKSSSCPLNFQQMLEQAFLWPKLQNVYTDTGAMGLFDAKYYQDPTPFGIPPVHGSEKKWVKSCMELIAESPNACVLPHGVLSMSGEGEGLYDGYFLRNAAGRVIAIAVDFLLYGAD